MSSNDSHDSHPRPSQSGGGQVSPWHHAAEPGGYPAEPGGYPGASGDDYALPAGAEPYYVVEDRPGDAPTHVAYPSAGYPQAGGYETQQYGGTAPYAAGSYPQQYQTPQAPQQYQAYQAYQGYYGYAPQTYYGAGHPGAYGYQPPVASPPAKPSKARRALLGVGAAALAAGLVLAGAAIAQSRQSASGTVASPPGISNGGGIAGGGTNGGGTSGGGTSGNGSGNQGILPGGPGSASRNGMSTSASVATKKQQVGIVTIVSVLSYQSAESAGTGMVLNSDGEVLTNNHVINGATSITVTVESTGRSYRADVVGTAPTKDVAVLQLRNASGLATAKIASGSAVAVGDRVTGVGNAGGTGTLRAAAGTVTALGQSITATDESGQNPEKLTGLIETNAGIVAGDSGGPLYDAAGSIIGMDTAASASTRASNAYAIPIATATSIASQIHDGQRSSVIHIGLPAFIGVSVDPATSVSGAGVVAVVPGGPADGAGITAGSVITGVDNTQVTSPTELKKALSAYRPGQSAKLTWTDTSGGAQSASVTLVAGPAD